MVDPNDPLNCSLPFQAFVAESIREFGQDGETGEEDIAAFVELLDYVPVDAKGEPGWAELKRHLREVLLLHRD